MLWILLPKILLSKTAVGIWGEVFFWRCRTDWHSDSCRVWECHRGLQASMDKPKVLGTKNLQQLSFLKSHMLLKCLSSTSVARWVNSLTPSYYRTAASIKDLGNSPVLHFFSCSPQSNKAKRIYLKLCYVFRLLEMPGEFSIGTLFPYELIILPDSNFSFQAFLP